MAVVRIDTSALTYPGFLIPGHTEWLNGAAVPAVLLEPGTYNFQVAAGYYAGFSFRVTGEGMVDYDAVYDAFLAGRGTSTLVVRGITIRVDTTALSHHLMPMWGGWPDWLGPGEVHTVTLVPASLYGFQLASGFAASFTFGVDRQGQVTYNPGLDGFLSGRGTDTLVIRGCTIQLDGRALSHDVLLIVAQHIGFLPRGEVHAVTLVPCAGYGFQSSGGAVADVSFAVGTDGLISYDPVYDGFLSGRGTSRLVLRGYPVIVDGSSTSSAFVGIANSGDLYQQGEAPRLFVILLPASYDLHLSTGWSEGFPGQFRLHPDGQVTVAGHPLGALSVSAVPRVDIHHVG